MKEKLFDVGSYLLAGIVSCTVLVAVSKCMSEESPLPVTVQSADCAPAESAAGEPVPLPFG